MGPIVKDRYFKHTNLVVTCSSSGKLTSSLFKYWVDEALHPVVGDSCMLLLDSWTSQQNDDNFAKFSLTDKSCNRFKIPEKTTSTTQPLDVYFFRQWKLVVHRFYDWVMLEDLSTNLGRGTIF